MEFNEKMKELEIQDALAYTESIINTVHDPLIILGPFLDKLIKIL